jgi:hypothetical protein
LQAQSNPEGLNFGRARWMTLDSLDAIHAAQLRFDLHKTASASYISAALQ